MLDKAAAKMDFASLLDFDTWVSYDLPSFHNCVPNDISLRGEVAICLPNGVAYVQVVDQHIAQYVVEACFELTIPCGRARAH